MAVKNRLWGAERIRGELLKLGMHVCKRTIQKYMRPVRVTQPRGQKWSTFLRNHAKDVWACDALAGERSLLSLARRRSSLSSSNREA
jgi:putative transposase